MTRQFLLVVVQDMSKQHSEILIESLPCVAGPRVLSEQGPCPGQPNCLALERRLVCSNWAESIICGKKIYGHPFFKLLLLWVLDVDLHHFHHLPLTLHLGQDYILDQQPSSWVLYVNRSIERFLDHEASCVTAILSPFH